MGFLYSYKRLEKLCGEVYDSEGKISTYIDEMKKIPNGSLIVENWDDDLKKLIHYRCIRNKIVHDPNCNEKNMCELADAIWLEDFYARVMDQRDPLALYNKATKTKVTHVPKSEYDLREKTTKDSVGCSVLFLICILVIAIVIVVNILI